MNENQKQILRDKISDRSAFYIFDMVPIEKQAFQRGAMLSKVLLYITSDYHDS